MKLSAIDYGLVSLARHGAGMLRSLGRLESSYLRGKLDETAIEKPLFVTGLARSGTTILLEQLTRTDLFATHRYRDFPFLHIPYWWNTYLDLAANAQQPVPRPHQDRIQISADSPEAFEEPLWQQFFPTVHAHDALHILRGDVQHKEFEAFFKDHLRKILLIRKRPRYLSKGNYNVTRLEYLGRILPDAQFVIPVRHPVDHVHSLVKQHELFRQYAQSDKRLGTYLASAGHYEFGPQRQAIRISKTDGDRTQQAWERGNQHLGYAIQWSQVYRFVDELRHRGDELATRMHVIRYEDFCDHPLASLESILSRVDLPADSLHALEFDHISPSDRHAAKNRAAVDEIWRETGLVAELFGYRPASGRTLPLIRASVTEESV